MRDRLASRFGFIMLASGCAVGLGNVWRFPFVTGQNGGGAFVLVYLAFLAILGFPLLVVELAVGRAGESGIASALAALSHTPRAARIWKVMGLALFAGNLLLMMYYTDVAGWLVRYAREYLCSTDVTQAGTDFASRFTAVTGDSFQCALYMVAIVALASAICFLGVVKGVERVTKVLMVSLLALLGFLAVRALTLPRAADALRFYLYPDWGRFMEHPWRAMMEAMGQAFFTLSVGVGCMTIFGSYIDRGNNLAKDAAIIIAVDTAVALLSGLVIFPACVSYGVEPSSGPGLIFIALPEVFARMPFGRFWGACFFLFLAFAAFTTVLAVFECLIGGLMDLVATTKLAKRASRAGISFAVGFAVAAASLPCIFFNGVLEAEDFAMSQLWLPLGALALGLFAANNFGWGWRGFTEELGIRLPSYLRWHITIVVPLLILAILIGGLAI